MSREPLTLPRTADVRRLLVAEEDVAAARRLSSVLARPDPKTRKNRSGGRTRKRSATRAP
jgi:hypothetical protein